MMLRNACTSSHEYICVNRPHMTERLTALPRQSNLFHLCSLCYAQKMADRGEPVDKEELVLSVAYALSRAHRLWPKKMPHERTQALKPIARKVLDHLEMCGVRWSRKKQPKAHKTF